jgi:YidC/Oxa1 family membrane protein insertase
VDRNTTLALILSVAVMLLWGMYQEQYAAQPRSVPPEVTPEVVTEKPPPSTSPSSRDFQPAPAETPPTPVALPDPAAEERLLIFEKPLYIAEFTSLGGGLKRWQLRAFDHGPKANHSPIVMTNESDVAETTLLTPMLELGLGDLSRAIFDIESEDGTGVRFRYSRGGVTVRKIYTLGEDPYSIRLRLQVENASSAEVAPEFGVRWPATVRDSQDFSTEAFAVLHEGSVERQPLAQLGSAGFMNSLFGGGDAVDPEYLGDVDWAGIDTTYFLGVVLPDNPARARVKITPTERGKSGYANLFFPAVQLPAGQTTEQEFRVYLGPKEPELLEALGGETIRAIDLGFSWIEPLVLGFGWLLQALYSIIPNYGLAIILLTILVRVVTMPLTNRQMRSMERMRELQPKVKELQAKHGDDRQKQSEEMMKLYKTEGVNPLGGCFPMLLQLPVFIGLFYALRSSIQLRQAPFVGWISDLSAPETLFTIPGIEIPIRVLPLVMGVSMVAQQKLTPTTAMDPAQARMMMTIMPIMMTVLFYQFPSGLVLYWFVSNILAIGHQMLIGRRMRSGS